MPVTPVAVTTAIIAAGPLLKGPAWFQLAAAIGVGVVGWSIIPVNVFLTGNTTGTIGGGVVTGKLVVPPIPLPVVGSLSAAGMIGLNAPQVAVAVGIGIGTAYSASGAYVGASVGAIGPNVSKVVFANPTTLVIALNLAMAAQGIIGPASKQLSVGLAPGIAAMFLTGFGTGVAAGPAGPAPGTGVSTASII
mgnify:FL=1|jgi:hypothetical protein